MAFSIYFNLRLFLSNSLSLELWRHIVTSLNVAAECRTSEEVETILCETRGSKVGNGGQTFPRLLLAIDYKQKEFIAHPNVQQVTKNRGILLNLLIPLSFIMIFLY